VEKSIIFNVISLKKSLTWLKSSGVTRILLMQGRWGEKKLYILIKMFLFTEK